MKHFAMFSLLMIVALVAATPAMAQLSGIKTIDNTGSGNYISFTAAINDLNTVGVGPGGVTFNVVAGQTFNENPPNITATGTSSDQIVFQKSGIGANPLIIPTTAGTRAPSSLGSDGDAVIKIVGGDYITFDAIDIQDNATFTTPTQKMESGFFLVKASATDACKNVTIRNCTITLDKTAVNGGAIFVSNLDAAGTSLTVTSQGGRSENISIYGNTLTNVFCGIELRGYAHTSAPYDFYDQNIQVGVGGGNTITNYGSGSGTAYAIYAIYQNNLKINNNTITGTVSGTATTRGIYTSSGTNSNVDIIGNTVSALVTTITANSVTPIENAMGATGTTNTINIKNNLVQNTVITTALTTSFNGIVNSIAASMVNIDSNTVSGNTLTGTGTFNCIQESGSPTTLNIRGNQVYNNAKTGASGTLYCVRASTSLITFAYNSIHDNSVPTSSGTSSSNIYGYYDAASATSESYYNNTIYNLSLAGTTTSSSSVIYGIYTYTVASSVKNIYGNTLYGLAISNTGGGTISGIYHSAGATTSIYKNNLYNFNAVATGGTAYGIYVSSGTTNFVYNNFISDLRTPAATGTNAINGIYFGGGTSDYAFYNTVYLNATSSSATTFGTTGIYGSTTPTTDFRNNIIVNLSTPGPTGGLTVAHRRSSTTLTSYASASNNNDFYAGTPGASRLIYYDGTNSDQTIGAYKTRVAPRDAAAFTENPPFVNVVGPPYDLHMQTAVPTQTESGGTPVTSPIILATDYDGDARNASSPDVGADEFAGIALDLTPPSIAYTTLTNSTGLSTRSFTNVTITDASGVNTSGGTKPRVYYKKSTNANTVNDNTSGTDGWKYAEANGSSSPFDFTIDYSLIYGGSVSAGDIIQYFVVAQDLATTPNVGINLGSFAATPASVALTSAAFPIGGTINQYTIVSALSGTKTVGSTGDYTTLKAAFDAINGGVVSGNLTLTVLASGTTEAATAALNAVAYEGGTWTITIKPDVSATPTITGSIAGPLVNLNGTANFTIDGSNTNGGTTKDLTLANTNTGGTVVQYINGTSGTTMKNCVVQGVGTTYGDLYFATTTGTGNNNNTVQNCTITRGATSPIYGVYILGSASPNDNVGNVITQCQITDFSNTGIYLSGNARNTGISQNSIYSATTQTSTTLQGIDIHATSVGGTVIERNKIYDLKTSGASPTFRGIYLYYGSTTLVTTIKNNFIALDNSTTTSGATIYGIQDGSGTGYLFDIYFNSIYIGGAPTTGTSATYGYYRGYTSTTNFKDNIISNARANAGATGKNYAIYQTVTSGLASNYNDLYASGSGASSLVGYYSSADRPTLANWSAAAQMDSQSVSGDPQFSAVATGDLHINPAVGSPVDNAGITIGTVADDFDGNARGPNPDIGADEYAVNMPGAFTLLSPGNASTNQPLSGTLSWNVSPAAAKYDVYLSTTTPPTTLVSGNQTGTTYLYSGLSPNTTYYWSVDAKNSSGTTTATGAPWSFTTLLPPNAPTGLTLTNITNDAMDLSWTDNSSDELGFYIFKSTNGTTFTLVDSTAASVATYTGPASRTLGPNAHVWWRVTAYNVNGQSGYTAADAITLAMSLPITEGFENTTFPPPGWTSALLSGSVNWDRVTSGSSPSQMPYSGVAEARYNSYSASAGSHARLMSPPFQLPLGAQGTVKFQMYHDNGYSGTFDSVVVEASTDYGTTWHSLQMFQRYGATNGWQAHAVPLAGYSGTVMVGFHAWSQYGNNMFMDSVMIITLPKAPSNLTLTNVTTDSMDIHWTDNSTDENGFYLYRSNDGSIFTKVDSIGANGTEYIGLQSRGLGPNSHRWWRLTAYNNFGEGGYAAADTTTLAVTPGAPTIGDITYTTMVVILTPGVNPAPTEFLLQVSYTGKAGKATKYVNPTGDLVDSTVWGTYAAFGGSGGVTAKNLTPGTTYTFESKARNGSKVETSFGPTVQGTTTVSAPPNAPTNLALTNVTAGSMDLGWTDNATDENGFYVYLSTDGSIYTKVDSVAADVVAYTGAHSRSLSPNTHYWWRVAAHNANGVSDHTQADSTTLAVTPGTPVLSNASYNTMTFTLDPATNPASTQFVVRVVYNALTQYLDPSGVLTGSPVWGTYADFGGASGKTVTGLLVGTSYTYDAKARNASTLETAYGPTASLSTLTYPGSFSEDFTTYTTGYAPPPTGWNEGDQKDILDGGTFGTPSNGSWTYDGFGNVGTTGAPRFNYYSTYSDDHDWIVSPHFSLAAKKASRLVFDLALTPYSTTDPTTMDANDTLFVVVSTDGGNTFPRSNVIGTFDASTPISNTGQTEYLSLAAFSGQGDLRIGFYAKDLMGSGDYNIYFDNARVEAIVAKDIQVMSVSMSPGPPYYQGIPVTVTAQIRNNGTEPNPTSVPLTYKPGAEPSSYGDGTAETIAPSWTGNTATVSFTTTYTPGAVGSLTMYVKAFYPSDAVPSNDVATRTVTILRSGAFFEDWTDVNALLRWKVVNNDGGSYTWVRTTSKFLSAPAAASSHYESGTLRNDDWLITPKLTVAPGDSFTFYHSAYSTSFPESLYVRISTTGSDPSNAWTDLLQIRDATLDWKYKAIDLTPYAGQNVYIAFVNRGLDEYYIFVDDITGPAVYVPAIDMAFTSFNQISGTPVPKVGGNPVASWGMSALSQDDGSKPEVKLIGKIPGTRASNVSHTMIIADNTQDADKKLSSVSVQSKAKNMGTSSTAYSMHWAVSGAVQPVYNGPTVPSGATDSAVFTYTPAARGTFLTLGQVAAPGDEIPANDSASFRMRIYPDTMVRTILDRGDNLVDVFIGWGNTSTAMKAAVRYTAAQSQRLAGVDFIYRTETVAPGTIQVQVRGQGDSSGAPGAVLYTQDYSTIDYFPGAGDYVTLPFGSDAPAVAAGSTFWITVKFPVGIPFPGGAHNTGFTAGHSYYEDNVDTTIWHPLVITTERAWIMRAYGVPVAPGFAVAPSSVAFGNVPVGTSKPDSVNVMNTGDFTLTISSVTSNNPLFTVSPTSGVLPQGGSKWFRITFSPLAAGLQSASIVFQHNATGSPTTVPVTGTGTTGLFQVSPASIAFGTLGVGSTKSDSVEVTNGGLATLVIDSVKSTMAWFQVNPTSGTIPPAGSASFHITFAPLDAGYDSADIVFWHNAPSSPGSMRTYGTGAWNSVAGMKFKDVNTNGVKDLGEPGIQGWTIYLAGPKHDTLQTSGDGSYLFQMVPDGQYTVSEESKTNWVQTMPQSPGTYALTLAGGQVITGKDFGNFYRFDTLKYRTLPADSFAYARDLKGKYKPVKKATDKVDFSATVKCDSANITDLHVEFGAAIDLAYPLTTTPPSTPSTTDLKLKKWDFVFLAPLQPNDYVTIEGYAKNGKALKISKYTWTRGSVTIGKSKRDAVITSIPKFPKPNALNLVQELYPIQSFPDGGTLLVGVAHPENPKAYGWVLHKKYTDVVKSFADRNGVHTKGPRCFDTFESGRPLVKQQTSLPPGKQNNVLFAEQLALKLNIEASATHRTPVGLGELKLDVSEIIIGPPGAYAAFDGKSVREISQMADAYLTNCTTPDTIAALYDIIHRINYAFQAPFDTVQWGGGIVLTAPRSLGDVAFLKFDASVPPVSITPLVNNSSYYPEQFMLYQNYPNPFNPTTTIQFDLPVPAYVGLKIYNMLGQEVATLLNHELMDDGTQEMDFDASNLATGVYFYRIVAEGLADDENGTPAQTYVSVKKMMLIK